MTWVLDLDKFFMAALHWLGFLLFLFLLTIGAVALLPLSSLLLLFNVGAVALLPVLLLSLPPL